MYEVIFLIALGIIWMIFASVQDMRKREVANWLNFSLIIFALAFRLFYSIFAGKGNYMFFIQGLIGLGIFFVLGNVFYYGRVFAGGDAKLMIALGTILPLSTDFFTNIKIFLFFLVIFLFVSSFYGLAWSVFLALKNRKLFKKNFVKKVKRHRAMILISLIIGVLLIALSFGLGSLLFIAGFMLIALPFFYIYARSVDESCMLKQVSAKELGEGDWLYKDVHIKGKTIKSSWEGLSKSELSFLRKNLKGNKKLTIRQGIPLIPSFLISFIIFLTLWYSNWQYQVFF